MVSTMDSNFAMKNLNYTVGENATVEEARKHVTRDSADLAYFGKKQQLRRNFSMISIVGLTCTLMITWEGVLFLFAGNFENGGPTGLVGGYIFAWAGTFLQTLVMSEIGSMIPLAGGQYNWVSILAPSWCSKFLSYLTGWITLIGWVAISASGALLSANLIQGLAALNHPDYAPTRWQATLIFLAVIVLSLLINTYLARLLPKVEATVLIIHVLGFFAVLIPVVYMAPKGSNADVFQTFLNMGEWPSDGLSFFIGSTSTMFAFMGIDGATHMAEEIENAATVIPRSMLVTVALNGVLGFSMLIAVLYCLGDVDTVLNTPTGFPFMQIFYDATLSTAGTTVLASLVTFTAIAATIGVIATCSRMMWAFAREKALPGSAYLSIVEPRSALPLWSIAVTTILNVLLAIINIGSSTAFNALTGLTIAAFYTSFTISALVMLRKRWTTPDSEIRWGTFKLGRIGTPVYIAAIAYSVIGTFFSFWPSTVNPTPESMNWSIVVFGGALIISMVHWTVWARKTYTGPVVEVTQ